MNNNDAATPAESEVLNQTSNVELALNVIDFEIERIESEQSRPGWTLWAVYGTIASLLWLLGNEYEKGHVDIFNVAQLLLVLWIVRDVVHYSTRQLAPVRHRPYPSPKRFVPATAHFSPSEMFFYWIRFVALFFLSLLLMSKIKWFFSVPLLLFYGLMSLIVAIGLIVATYYDPLVITKHVPQKRIADNRKIVITWCLITISILISAIAHLNYLSRYPDLVSLSDLRSAGLLLVLFTILPKSFESEKNKPILGSLTEIRRDLAFGRLSPESGLRNADIAIRGLLIEEKLQEELSAALSLFERFEVEYDRVSTEVKVFMKELPTRTEEITAEQRAKARMVMLAAHKSFDSFLKQSDDIEKMTKSLRIHSTSAREVAPKEALASSEALSRIDAGLADLGKKAEALWKELEPTLQKLGNAKQ